MVYHPHVYTVEIATIGALMNVRLNPKPYCSVMLALFYGIRWHACNPDVESFPMVPLSPQTAKYWANGSCRSYDFFQILIDFAAIITDTTVFICIDVWLWLTATHQWLMSGSATHPGQSLTTSMSTILAVLFHTLAVLYFCIFCIHFDSIKPYLLIWKVNGRRRRFAFSTALCYGVAYKVKLPTTIIWQQSSDLLKMHWTWKH